MNSGLTSHQQRGHTETGPRFKVSPERPRKRGIDLAIPGFVAWRVIHYTIDAQRNCFGKSLELTRFYFAKCLRCDKTPKTKLCAVLFPTRCLG